MTTDQADVVIITALDKERDAVLRHLTGASESRSKLRTYHVAMLSTKNVTGPYKIVLTSLAGMGNIHAAVATQQAIGVWNPQYIILADIAGGMQKGTARYLGDVLVGEQIVGYEFGKQKPDGIERRYQVYRPAKGLIEAAKGLPQNDWLSLIQTPRPDGSTGRVLPHVHFGVVASGEKVVADAALTRELHSDWADIAGSSLQCVVLM